MMTHKLLKKCLIIPAILILLLLLGSCESKKYTELEKANMLLDDISDQLRTMIENLEVAQEYEYESMLEEIGIEQIRCEEMKRKIDDYLLFGSYSFKEAEK